MKVFRIIEGSLGEPQTEIVRAKGVVDLGHTIGQTIRLADMSLDDILDQLSTNADFLNMINFSDTKHIEVDSKYMALVLEVANRAVRQYKLKNVLKSVSER